MTVAGAFFMDGVLLINKPSGMTSHDVVERVRRILKEKRVGHTGTLDPLATGLLVMCVGTATRFARFFEAGEKEYEAVMRLGVVTDTQDAEGRALEERTYRPPEPAAIVETFRRFTGPIVQQPPAFSALKVGGVASYKLARQGKAVSLKPRDVAIYSLDLLAFEDPFIRFAVRCSKGTYIRTLCADIGSDLGMGAHLTSLVRTRSGRFALREAVTIDELAARVPQGLSESTLIPIGAALDFMPARTLTEEEATGILHGRSVHGEAGETDGTLVRLYDPSKRFIGLGLRKGDFVKPEIVLPARS